MKICLSLFFVFLAGCGPTVYYVKPSDWKTPERQDSTILAYAQYLKGVKIYLDPGHGGEDRYNHGPAYDVIEPDINLIFSRYFSEYLRRAGAIVIVSRDKDTTVKLSDRPKLCNASGADIFISVHHNATGSDQESSTNFTSVWYHAREGDPEYHPSNHDIARYIQRDLAYAMGNPGSPSSFDGTMSDYSIYPNAGFAVLRLSSIPAALIEGSFFSSAYEEQRLKLEEFNAIEAWGAFKGLARYMKAGIPKLETLSDSVFTVYRPVLQFAASDKFGIDPRSVQIFIDRKEIGCTFDRGTNVITALPDSDLSNGKHRLEVIVRNKNGNASFPFRKNIYITPPVDSIFVAVSPENIPPVPECFTAVHISAFDKKGNPAADGTELSIAATEGKISPAAFLSGGKTLLYYYPPKNESSVIIKIASGRCKTEAVVAVAHRKEKYICGTITDSLSGKGIQDALVAGMVKQSAPFPLPVPVQSSREGKYILLNDADALNFTAAKAGYFGESGSLPLPKETAELNLALTPIASGILHGKTFVINPALGGCETGASAILDDRKINSSGFNLAIAARLGQLLGAAGGNIIPIRTSDTAMTVDERLKKIETVKEGIFLTIETSDTLNCARIDADPTAFKMKVGYELLRQMAKTAGCDTAGIRFGRSPLSDGVPFVVLSLVFPQPGSRFYADEPADYYANIFAWSIYRGILRTNGYKDVPGSIRSYPPKSFPPNSKVVLDYSLVSVSKKDGSCSFWDVDGSKGKTKHTEN